MDISNFSTSFDSSQFFQQFHLYLRHWWHIRVTNCFNFVSQYISRRMNKFTTEKPNQSPMIYLFSWTKQKRSHKRIKHDLLNKQSYNQFTNVYINIVGHCYFYSWKIVIISLYYWSKYRINWTCLLELFTLKLFKCNVQSVWRWKVLCFKN